MTTIAVLAALVAAISFALGANRPFFTSLAVIAVVVCVKWLP